MNKRDFIQRAVINWMPVFKNERYCVRRAEQVWSALSEAGYGATSEKTPEECKSKNWYTELTDQEAFDRCWAKYGRRGDRNKAAKAWLKLNDADKSLVYSAIIRYLDDIKSTGTSQAHFSTWLNESRWLSYPEPEKREAKSSINESAQAIAHLKRQIEMTPDGDLKEALKKQLETQSVK